MLTLGGQWPILYPMPSFPKAEWNNCEVFARPMGWRKIFCLGKLGLIPYIIGDEIKLKVTLKQGKKSIIADTLFYNEEVSQGNQDASEKVIKSISITNQPNQRIELPDISSYTGFPEDRKYSIYSEKDSRRRLIMSATVFRSEVFIWAALIVFGGAIGSVIGLIIWLLNRFLI